jgi:gamma-glutamyl:cysteine ligase YbdK (ATP-grasp superfamily)
MGGYVDRDRYSDAEIDAFQRRLHDNIHALRELLARPGFGVGPASLGAELEASIVGPAGWPLPINEAVVQRCNDPQVQLELVGFNVEYNLAPVPAAGRPLSALESQLDAAIAVMGRACAEEGGRLIPVGIVPTSRPEDLHADVITDQPRYRALVNGMAQVQPFPVPVHICGSEESVQIASDSLAVEGSNTSFQLHLRVDPERFADTYNAAQLATPIALVLAANSPIFLGRLLWDETRVPLFKQIFAGRQPPSDQWRPTVRVPFGHGWVRRGIHDLLAEAVALYPPVIGATDDEDPLQVVRDGGVPQLSELRLHQGTIWQWNRAVYDPADGGHVRVELRALPSGPTPLDMVATAAFLLGLVVALRDELEDLLPAFPFRYAEHNFYRAAQRGLDATLLWPTKKPPSPAEHPVLELIDELLPRADEGLDRLGVDAADRARYLSVIRDRRAALTTGARWMRRSLLRLDAHHQRPEALQRLTQAYLANVATGRPVHEWSEVAG